MNSKLCSPYEGEQPYLYVSYCPEDIDIIRPILCFLQNKGYRLWYNDVSVSDSEWPSVAAYHLDQSAVFLALISENWVASHRCLDEFAFAQMKHLPSLAVILEPVQLTPVMNLQIVSVPAVDYSNQGEPKEFHDKLMALLDKLDPKLRSGPKPAPPILWNKLALIIGVSAVLIFIVGITAALLTHGRANTPPDTPDLSAISTESSTIPAEAETTPSPVVEPGVDYSSAYRILLTAPGDMSSEELTEALSTLKDRLDIFTDGEPYEMNVEADSIELYLPKSAFAGIDVEKVLKCYITRATKLYIFNRASPSTARELEAIRRDDLADVTLSQGTIPGVDAVQYGIYSPTYNYLTIRLTDQCAEWFADEITAWGDGLAFGQDMEDVLDYAYSYTFPAGDGKTFYILNDDFDGRFLETQAYNLTHDPLPDNFLITIDLNSLADWQTAESGSRMGENQCNPVELEEETVTFILEGYNHWTAEDVLNTEKELKTRLDMLGQPYALGQIEDEEEDVAVFAVKTGMAHMGLPVISLICGDTVQLQTNYWNIDLYNCNFDWKVAPDGSSVLALEVDTKITDQLTDLIGGMVEQDDALCLTVGGLSLLGEGGLPVLSAAVGQSILDGQIIFDHIYFGQETKIVKEYHWLMTLMKHATNNSSSGSQLHWLSRIQMNLENGVIGYDESRLGLSYAREEQAFADAVYSILPDATVDARRDLSCAYVSLDMDPNEALPEKMTTLAKEIYEASGFERSIFQNLTIYFIKEDSFVNEHAHLIFQKEYSCVLPQLGGSPPDNGCTYVSGMFQGERLQQYQAMFQDIVETDPFYLNLTWEGLTSWKW